MACAANDMDRIVAWVERHQFQRVALQFPDELLRHASQTSSHLRKVLPGRKIFILGDSAYGSHTVDEVAAEHYGADCIVHIGPSDQQHSGEMPVLFIFCQSSANRTSDELGLVGSSIKQLDWGGGDALLIVADAELQDIAKLLASDLVHRMPTIRDLVITEPSLEAHQGGALSIVQRDWRFGLLPVGAWWACVGTLVKAAVASQEELRICGRSVLNVSGGQVPKQLPRRCGILYVGSADSALERRLVLRYSQGHRMWRWDPLGEGMMKLSSQGMLLRRYRFVELAKAATIIGILMSPTGSHNGRAMADRLETLLRRAGRRVYRFMIGRLAPEKLGNFPRVECFVSLASPEHFPFDTRDLHVPIASPYEVEVALGVRDWTGEYIIDLDELLRAPVTPALPQQSVLAVQTLGSGSHLRHFVTDDGTDSKTAQELCERERSEYERRGGGLALPKEELPIAPALATKGLSGVPGRYTSEALA